MSAGHPPIAAVRERVSGGREHAKSVRAMFERIAPTYDRLNRVLSVGLDVAWRRRAVALLDGAPSGTTIDLCAGTMDLSALVCDRRGGRVVAVDFAAPMLRAGQAKAPSAEIVVADALALPFADREATAVICGFGMRNLSDPRRGIDEVKRVLAPGGVFVTLEFFRPEHAATRLFHKGYASILLPLVGGALSGDRAAYAYLARSMKGFLSRTEYQRALAGAGFVGITGTELSLGVASIVRAEIPS